ncbi:MAG: alanine--tRNA ligase [Candidatus Bathyarchaeia archaeon]
MKFSEDEYRLPFFLEEGFIRRQCQACGGFFWTQNPDQDVCGDAPCQEYTFISEPPTRRSFSVREMREAFLSFFAEHGHTRIEPYPVVARWRDDLYVTIASIAAFQPYITEGVVPPPANPLVISQPCLRFTDIDNVGLTGGRHLSIFEMGGHHAFNRPDSRIYWKDETVRLHHQFVTEALGVDSELVTYKEGFWSGGGNAGPDLEGCVSGFETSTLVFMQYRVVNGELVGMPVKVVDTGYGVERFTWLSQGAPSGFHAVYGPLLDRAIQMAGLPGVEESLLVESTRRSAMMTLETTSDRMVLRQSVAKELAMDSMELDRILFPVECVYATLDHTKALAFMLAEGVVPSNVKVGYLSRLLIRRVYRLLRILGIEDRLSEIVRLQIDYWSPDFPSLEEMEGEILEALHVEERKYGITLKRGSELAKRMARGLKKRGDTMVPVEALVELYDSPGVPPEVVKEAAEVEGVGVYVPDNFYAMVAERHVSPPRVEEVTPLHELMAKVSGLPETEMLYYDDPYLKSFDAEVLRVMDGGYVVLDKTAFYAEGGGEPSDRGVLCVDGRTIEVTDVQKVGDVIVHLVEGEPPEEGAMVSGEIEWGRRMSLMRHHTATHILIGAARRVLGEHAWQAGAQKAVVKSRLDISHWERITPPEMREIEALANQAVMSNIPVESAWMPRNEAERRYGYRLYQGGIVPGSHIRVVKVGEWDVEACGGTHCGNTGEVGLIKIVRTERIQDGVERIVFSAGPPAVELVQGVESSLREVAEAVGAPVEGVVEAVRSLVSEWKGCRREVDRLKELVAGYEAERLLEEAPTVRGIRLITHTTKGDDVDFLIKVGSFVTKADKWGVMVAFGVGERVRVVAMAGEEAVGRGVHAGRIASEVARLLGGGGGGRPGFGQGGGVNVGRVSEALGLVKEVVERQIEGGGAEP